MSAMENDKKEDDGDLDNMFAMMAVGEPPELGLAGDIQVPVAEVSKPSFAIPISNYVSWMPKQIFFLLNYCCMGYRTRPADG